MASSHTFLYVIRPSRPEMLSAGPTEAEAETVARHFNYLDGLARQGVVVLAGRTTTEDDEAFGVVIFRAVSEQQARALMMEDPAVKSGVMHARLFPFRIAITGQ